MAIVVTDSSPTGPDAEERLAWERAVRDSIRRVFRAVLRDEWGAVLSIYREAEATGEWFAVALWAGLPATVREKIRDMLDEKRRR